MSSKRGCAQIGVLGAGIMGCCLALELAQRGYKVDLIELAAKPMTGASLHNEGKLHLGFVYANDPLKETHGLMLSGSLAFADILQRLTGAKALELALSQPFHYFVPVGSQMNMVQISDHFKNVEEDIKKVTSKTNGTYLAQKLDHYFEQNSPEEHQKLFSPDLTLGSFKTEERSVSPKAVADILQRAIHSTPEIHFIGSTKVMAVNPISSGGVEVVSKSNRKKEITTYPCVANCLWDDKLRIDRTAGVLDDGPWLLRYKATININLHSHRNINIPSATGILGPYGDVVNHGNNSYYLSWYPLCKRVQSTGDDGRRLHEHVHKSPLSYFVKLVKSTHPGIAKFLALHTHSSFIKNNIKEMAAYIPALEAIIHESKKCSVGGGVILARGATDIDDPGSYLHQRSSIGPTAYGSYVTIDTGKYCTAPLFAIEAADMISEIL